MVGSKLFSRRFVTKRIIWIFLLLLLWSRNNLSNPCSAVDSRKRWNLSFLGRNHSRWRIKTCPRNGNSTKQAVESIYSTFYYFSEIIFSNQERNPFLYGYSSISLSFKNALGGFTNTINRRHRTSQKCNRVLWTLFLILVGRTLALDPSKHAHTSKSALSHFVQYNSTLSVARWRECDPARITRSTQREIVVVGR